MKVEVIFKYTARPITITEGAINRRSVEGSNVRTINSTNDDVLQKKKEGKLSLKAKRRGADLQIKRLIFSKKSDKGVGVVSELLQSEKVRERE